jgi:uncharacterized protein
VPYRMTGLTLEHAEVVAAFQRLGEYWLSTDMDIDVFPLTNYLEAAVHSILKKPARTYDPASGDWAYIVNTNGDTYSHAEAYSPAGWMGNIFRQPMLDILRSPAHKKSLAPRVQRAQVCRACRFGASCSRIPLIEALPSERAFAADGTLRCPIALPMIDFFRDQLRSNTDMASLVADVRSQESHRACPA